MRCRGWRRRQRQRRGRERRGSTKRRAFLPLTVCFLRLHHTDMHLLLQRRVWMKTGEWPVVMEELDLTHLDDEQDENGEPMVLDLRSADEAESSGNEMPSMVRAFLFCSSNAVLTILFPFLPSSRQPTRHFNPPPPQASTSIGPATSSPVKRLTAKAAKLAVGSPRKSKKTVPSKSSKSPAAGRTNVSSDNASETYIVSPFLAVL
jgi:hypothetical protein